MTDNTNSVPQTVLHMAIPASIGMLLTFLFQLVDTYFIGQLGVPELAAVSFTFPVYMLLVGLFMGVASGTAATVGKALGEKQVQKVGNLAGVTLAFMFVAALGISGVAVLAVEPTFYGLGAEQSSVALIKQYMVPLYWGFPLLVVALICNAILMADGRMKLATIIMAIGGILNLVFDYLLIFGIGPFPKLGLMGAALATIISWGSIALLFLYYLAKKGLAPKGLAFVKESKSLLTEVLTISGPAVAAQVLVPIAIAVLTRLIASVGEEAVAAFGIATRVESLALTLVVALSVVITPIAAREFGAHSQKNIDRLIAFSGRLTVYWSIGVFLLLALFGRSLSTVFTDSAVAIEHIYTYFLIVGLSYPAYGLSLITMSLFNGVYRPKTSLKLTLVKTIGVTIPFALIGSLWGLTGIFVGVAIGNFIGAAYAFRLLNSWLGGTTSELSASSPWQDYKSDVRRFATFVKKRVRS